MTRNVGHLDGAIRLALGAALIGAALLIPTTYLWLAVSIAAIAMGTALLGVCPLYRALGLSTHRDRGRLHQPGPHFRPF
jgi:fatty acid desaturase